MFKTVDEIHTKTGKNRLYLFCDIAYCGLRYQAGYMDYKLFEMYDLNSRQRKTIITRGINNSFVRKYNNPEYTKYLRNKYLFNEKYREFLGREYMSVSKENFADFENFVNKHHRIVVKPLDDCCGHGVEQIEVDDSNIREIYDNILNSGRTLIEETATQIPELKNIHPTSINTMRIVTLRQKVVAAYLRIGNNNNFVDNLNHEGLAAPINIETGRIDYPAMDKKMNIYEEHPITKVRIIGFVIPNWETVREFTEKVSKIMPEVGYVGWDVSLNEHGPYLIEANEFPGHDIYQLPPHRTDGIGMLPVFESALKDDDINKNERE